MSLRDQLYFYIRSRPGVSVITLSFLLGSKIRDIEIVLESLVESGHIKISDIDPLGTKQYEIVS